MEHLHDLWYKFRVDDFYDVDAVYSVDDLGLHRIIGAFNNNIDRTKGKLHHQRVSSIGHKEVNVSYLFSTVVVVASGYVCSAITRIKIW